MKQRLTFLAPEATFFDVKDISIADGVFDYTSTTGGTAIEQRTTLSLRDLPKTLRSRLQGVHELHIRWTAWHDFEHLPPLVSRQPPGLHVFFTPTDGATNEHICSSLLDLFDENMKCDSVAESFSRPAVLSERFAASATYQFYHPQRSLESLINTLVEICTSLQRDSDQCRTQIRSTASASEISLDFDIISHALVITAVWPRQNRTQANEHLHYIDAKASTNTVEIGILAAEQPEEREELKLGGYLAVLGEDTKPSATMFSFPSRHHPLPVDDRTTYSAAFLQPTALHPTLAISLPRSTLKPPHETCALHTYLTLPSALFLDRYQLSEQALLTSKNLRALHALSGAEDLEAPDWTMKQWGSASLLEMAYPDSTQGPAWEIQIPLHLRYLRSEGPQASQTKLTVPWPVVFWACEAEEGLKMSTNPFDRVNIGYDGLFGPKTMFYHVPAGQQDLTLVLDVPVLSPAAATWLPAATLAVVTAGLAWVMWSFVKPISKTHKKLE